GRQVQGGDCGLHALDTGAEVDAFEAAGNGDVALQVFAANLLFAGVVFDGGDGAEGGGLAGGTVDEGVLNGVEGSAMLVVETDANGVGAAVLDGAVCNRNAFDNGGGIGGDLLCGEAEARGDGGVDAKCGGGAAY